MKKTELTKEQQEKFKWLMKAETIDEDVEIVNGVLTWKDGVWENGIWRDGVFKGGYWRNGIMWSNLKQRCFNVKYEDGKFEEIEG